MADEGNPLVATVDTGSWGGTANTESLTYAEGSREGRFSTGALSKDTEGAGLFSDAASTLGDASGKNWGGLAVDVVGDGMDLLGMAIDPFGSLAGAGIGWLIEHIGFLKKALDIVAGDPESVTAKSVTWTNVAKALSDAADQYESSARTLRSSNDSGAVNGAAKTGDNLATVLRGASSHASDAATAMKVAATAVGTTRGIIRDSLSQFAGDAIVKWIAATAAAFFTFGATEAAFVVDEVAEGTSLAVQNGSKLSKLLETLTQFKSGAKDSGTTLKDAATDLDRGAKNTDSIARDASDAGGAKAADSARTAPSQTTPDATAHSQTGGATPSDHGPTAPGETTPSASTTPSEAGGGTPSEHGPTAPSGETTPQHYWQKEKEQPSHDEVDEHVADHKQDVADHNDQVAQHNQKADQLKQDSEEHNRQAVDNQQKLADNNHARNMNQQAVNRARAQGKSHDSLNAQHRDLQAQHKSLTQEDQRLGQRQQELTQRKSDLHDEGTQLDKQATGLRTKQQELTHEKGDDVRRNAGLENERFDGSKIAGALRTTDRFLDGPVEGMHLADKIKEPFAQGLSDQVTRDDAVTYESDTKQHEFAEEQERAEQTSEPAGAPAWPTEHQG
jgi:hypothetical protein